MDFQALGVGVIAVAVGLAFCVAGYRFFLFLLPLWGFFAGFLLGANATQAIFNEGFLATALGWVVGFVIGIVFAALAYLFYWAAVTIAGASIGYWLGIGLMAALGVGPGLLAFVVGIVGAAIVAGIVIILRVPRYLLILISAFGGASAVIAGILLVFDQITVESLGTGVVGPIVKGDLLWMAAWIALGVAGLVIQVRTTANFVIVRTDYRYA